jgi:hypothetical protein
MIKLNIRKYLYIYLIIIGLHDWVFIHKLGPYSRCKLMIKISIHGIYLCRRNVNVAGCEFSLSQMIYDRCIDLFPQHSPSSWNGYS